MWRDDPTEGHQICWGFSRILFHLRPKITTVHMLRSSCGRSLFISNGSSMQTIKAVSGFPISFFASRKHGHARCSAVVGMAGTAWMCSEGVATVYSPTRERTPPASLIGPEVPPSMPQEPHKKIWCQLMDCPRSTTINIPGGSSLSRP